MAMTKEQAAEILERRGGSLDYRGFLEYYEALLLTWGWDDDQEREREVARLHATIQERPS